MGIQAPVTYTRVAQSSTSDGSSALPTPYRHVKGMIAELKQGNKDHKYDGLLGLIGRPRRRKSSSEVDETWSRDTRPGCLALGYSLSRSHSSGRIGLGRVA
jgi:hypothetical protein